MCIHLKKHSKNDKMEYFEQEKEKLFYFTFKFKLKIFLFMVQLIILRDILLEHLALERRMKMIFFLSRINIKFPPRYENL